MSSCCSLPFILNTNSAELCDASKTSQKQPSLQQDISPCHNSIDQLPKLHNIKQQQQQMQRQSVSAPATQSLPSAVDNPSCWIPKAPRHWTTSTTLPPCHSNVNHPITNVNICEQQRLQPLASTGHSNNVFVPPSVYNQRQQHLEYSSKSLTPYYYYRPSFRPGRHYYNQQFGIRPIMGHKVTASILSSVDFNDFKGSSGYPKGKIIRNQHNNIISHQKEHCFIERKSFQRRRYISKIAIGQSTSIKPQLLTLLIEGSSVESNNDFTSDTILPAQQCNTDVKKMYRLPTKRKFALLPLNLNQIHIEFSQPPDSISEKQSTIATTETKGFKGKNFNSFSKKSINNSISKNSKSQLSAFFIEGSSLASNNPTFMNDAIHKTTSDITLTQCSTTHYPLTKRKSVSLVNLNQIHIKFSQPFESNKHSIIVKKRNMFKVKCATDKSMDQHKSDSIDCPPVNDVSTCMFFPQDSTNKVFKTVLPKLKRLNKKIAKEIPIERNFGPPRTTYLNATSSYVTRSSTLRLEKKAKIAEDTFKMPNLYPDLFIVGSQFQSLSKLSDMVGDVIEITFNTVNNIIEATQGQLINDIIKMHCFDSHVVSYTI